MFETPLIEIRRNGFKAYCKKKDLPKIYELLKGEMK